MARGNPAALLWINHNAKKIWRKKYGSKDGKYKKAHTEAAGAYPKKHPKKSDVLLFVSSTRASTY